jgi:hypothetical protein
VIFIVLMQVLALLCRASPMAREQIRALETLRIVISEFLIAGSNHLTFEPRPSDELFVQDYNLEDQDGKMFQVMDDESRTDADESVEQRNADSASSELSASMQVVCMAAYSLTYLASSNEDQEVFRALQGIPLLLRMLMKVETQRIPFLVMYNFAWALGVVIDQNPVGQAEVCNIPGSLNFVLNLCRHTHVKIRRKAMLILTGLCQDSSARVYVRENKVPISFSIYYFFEFSCFVYAPAMGSISIPSSRFPHTFCGVVCSFGCKMSRIQFTARSCW